MYENAIKIELNDKVITSLKTCEIVKVHEKEITTIDFSNDGNLILTSGKDDLICVFDIERREIVRKLYNRKFGCENGVFTHNPKAILCSSNRDCKLFIYFKKIK
jgi:WD40 repeat protein